MTATPEPEQHVHTYACADYACFGDGTPEPGTTEAGEQPQQEGFRRAIGALSGEQLRMSPEEAVRRIRSGHSGAPATDDEAAASDYADWVQQLVVAHREERLENERLQAELAATQAERDQREREVAESLAMAGKAMGQLEAQLEQQRTQTQAARPTIEVAAAVIVRNGRVLFTRRRAGQSLADNWEFPGGKLDGNELPSQAVQREILEEIGCQIVVEEFLGSALHPYPDKPADALVSFFRCSLTESAEPQCLDVAECSWQDPNAVTVAPLLHGDLGIRMALARLPKESPHDIPDRRPATTT